MKKITKITALALALALLLGMTAFAAPTEIIFTDDFSKYTSLTDYTSAGERISYFEGETEYKTFTKGTNFISIPYGKILYNGLVRAQHTAQATIGIGTVNGKTVLTGAVATSSNNFYCDPERQFGYTLSEPWNYNEDYALVAQIGWIPTDADAGTQRMNNNQSNGFIGALMTTNDGTTDTNLVDSVAGYVTTKGKTSALQASTQVKTGMTHGVVSPYVTNGTDSVIRVVVRPYNLDNETVTSPEDGSLDIIPTADRGWTYLKGDEDSKHTQTSYHVSGEPAIKKIHGFYFGLGSYVNASFYDYKTYKVSLNPADFTITSEKAMTNVPVENKIEIAFSQPISVNTDAYLEGEGDEEKLVVGSLFEQITITREDGEALTYGTDYTLSVAEKSNETAIWDVLTITPADAWDMNTTYTVGIPSGIKNAVRITMADNTADEATADTVTFTTEAPPAYTMTLEAYKGLSTGTAATTIADGTMYFEAKAVKDAGAAVNGTLKIAVYEGDTIVKYATAKKAFANLGDSATLKVAFKVKAGQTVKAFVDGASVTEGSENTID